MFKHQPRKRFGQHFLEDKIIVERIIAALDPQPDQKIIEIGPGTGALTLPLLKQQGILHVVELDRDLANNLVEKCQRLGKLHVHCHDALDFDFSHLGNDCRIIGNLPYNISTPLIFHLLEYTPFISDMVFMLQREVVERMSAQPGGKEYGRLSVMVQSQCQTEKLFNVGPEAFTPPPKVESTVIKLTPYQTPAVEIINEQDFARIVKQAFAHRRKTLRNTLKGMLDEKQMVSIGIDPELRAEKLSISQFAALSNYYHSLQNQ